ncbi:MAG: PHB depolymerase family esterase [Bacteroidota bacterium]
MKKSTFSLLFFLVFTLTSFSQVKETPDPTYSLFHDGLKRTYLMHKPSGFVSGNNYPLLIALHGGHGSGKRMVDLTEGKFNALADKENFIVVYPDGIGRNWNDGRKNMPKSYKAHNNNVDDVGFLSFLIDELVRTHCVDPTRVYVTGMSNGSMMTERLAIELSDKIAAAAPVCGNIPLELKNVPKVPVAMMIINGTKDPLVPYDGGFVHFKKKKLGEVTSTDQTIVFWKKHNANSASAVVSAFPDINAADNCTVKKTVYGKAGDKNEIILICIEGGGHTWAGGWQYIGESFIGKTCRDVDACQLIWEFCKVHSK